jgi:beta-mannosidase
MAIESHRKNMPLCMGSLYWQLDDCWPVASWSGIDYYGEWKALHYFVRDAFKPVIVIPEVKDGKLEVTVVSDLQVATPVVLNLQWLNFNGNVLHDKNVNFTLEPNFSKVYSNNDISIVLDSFDLKTTLLNASLTNEKGERLCGNILYLLPPKELALPQPVILSTVTETSKGFRIQLTTDKLAKNIFIGIDGAKGFLTHNYFDILPHEVKIIDFETAPGYNISLAEFKSEIKILSLVDSYKPGE